MIVANDKIIYNPYTLSKMVYADEGDSLTIEIHDSLLNKVVKETISFKDEVVIRKLKELGYITPEESKELEKQVIQISHKCVALEKENERLKNHVLQLVDVIFSEGE